VLKITIFVGSSLEESSIIIQFKPPTPLDRGPSRR